MLHRNFDFKNPDYLKAFRERMLFVEDIRRHPHEWPVIKSHYREHPADMINDFGVTFDPRNADIGLPTLLPFVLFDRQREWVEAVMNSWRKRQPLIVEKSRDMGVSWLAMGLSCSICVLNHGVVIGVGSRKGDYVDKIGEHKPLLPKARMFMAYLPIELRGNWEAWRDAPHMRIMFPDTGSIISGEGGDNIGRGDRCSLYFVDEYAFFERPELTEASLSQTTNCRIDMSSVNGMANPFARKRWSGKYEVFQFGWRSDPRKDDAWYAKQCANLDPIVVAQEIDCDYLASVEGVVIPGVWARACIDAKTKLGIAPSGKRGIAADIADEGRDKNAVAHVHGTEVLTTEERSGKGGDLYETTQWLFALCDEFGYDNFRYDADGLGASVRGDARVINEARAAKRIRTILATGFRGSQSVFNPEGIVEGTIGTGAAHGGRIDRGRTNEDYFANRKAQGWWELRRRARNTYRWVTQGIACPADDILSISSDCKNHMKLVAELSQPTFKQNGVGKILINKTPDNTKSPNLADAVMIHYAPMEAPPVTFTSDMVRQLSRAGVVRRR